jgi:hypothetical protein
VRAVVEPSALSTVEVECKYRGYLERQRREIRELRQAQSLFLPPDFDFNALPSLSMVEKEKLTLARPSSVHAASRIPGIRPSSLMVLFKHARRLDENKALDEERLSHHQALVGTQLLEPATDDAPPPWEDSFEGQHNVISGLRARSEETQRI